MAIASAVLVKLHHGTRSVSPAAFTVPSALMIAVACMFSLIAERVVEGRLNVIYHPKAARALTTSFDVPNG